MDYMSPISNSVSTPTSPKLSCSETPAPSPYDGICGGNSNPVSISTPHFGRKNWNFSNESEMKQTVNNMYKTNQTSPKTTDNESAKSTLTSQKSRRKSQKMSQNRVDKKVVIPKLDLSVNPDDVDADNVTPVGHQNGKSIMNNLTRTVFVGIDEFYRNWRDIRSEILFDAIIILPNIYEEWILDPVNYGNDIFKQYQKIFDDHVFIKTLQWKHHQNLLICNIFDIYVSPLQIGSNKHQMQKNTNSVDPFWEYLSFKLIDLSLNPLIFTEKYYKSKLYKAKYGTPSLAICIALLSINDATPTIIKEILYQSNPTLDIIDDYNNVQNIDFDNLLEELTINDAATEEIQKKLLEEEEMKKNANNHEHVEQTDGGDADEDDGVLLYDDEWLNEVSLDIGASWKNSNTLHGPTTRPEITPFSSLQFYKRESLTQSKTKTKHLQPTNLGIKAIMPQTKRKSINHSMNHSRNITMTESNCDGWWISDAYE